MIRQKNGGLSAARNAALDLIERDETFEYIAFVDSDDKVLPEFLSHFVQNAVQTQADISVCGFFKFNDEGRTKTEGVIQTARTIDQEEFVELIFSMLRWEKNLWRRRDGLGKAFYSFFYKKHSIPIKPRRT